MPRRWRRSDIDRNHRQRSDRFTIADRAGLAGPRHADGSDDLAADRHAAGDDRSTASAAKGREAGTATLSGGAQSDSACRKPGPHASRIVRSKRAHAAKVARPNAVAGAALAIVLAVTKPGRGVGLWPAHLSSLLRAGEAPAPRGSKLLPG